MAITVDFYIFSKADNSTKRPSGTAISHDCTLKDTTGLISPQIELALSMGENPVTFNYAYIQDFQRYYFVTDWTWNRGLWIASLEIDSLATWKEEIGSSTQYILRSKSEFDGAVLDSIYPTKAGITVTSSSIDNPWASTIEEGSYVLGIIGSDSTTIGAVSYYVFTQAQLNTLNSKLMSNADWLNIPVEEISEELSKALFNPYQYIVSAVWFPFSVSGGTSVSNLEFGWWSLAVPCRRLSSSVTLKSYNFDVPKHPQALTRGTYLNLEPYSRYVLTFKPWGMIPLDSTRLISTDKVYVSAYIDNFSGKATIYVTGGATFDNLITTDVAMVGVPIQLAQIARDYLGLASTAAQTAGDVTGSIFRGDIAGVISGGISGIASSIKAAAPQLRTSGSTGSFTDLKLTPRLQGQFFPLVDELIEKRGRPLCSPRAINTLSGYILVADAEVEIPATAEEITRIVDYMEGGFYYE